MLETVVINPSQPAKACIIWLHGLGADGHDFAPIVPELKLPDSMAVRFVFPHAPIQSVTLNDGMLMRAWFNIYALSIGAQQDEEGIRRAQEAVDALIMQEIKRGIPANKIILAGFSQGGALALHCGLRYSQSLAGILGLSTVLPLAEYIMQEASSANKHIPILLTHGIYDSVIPLSLAELSKTALTQFGYQVGWHTYPMPHSVCAEEIADVSAWIQERLI